MRSASALDCVSLYWPCELEWTISVSIIDCSGESRTWTSSCIRIFSRVVSLCRTADGRYHLMFASMYCHWACVVAVTLWSWPLSSP